MVFSKPIFLFGFLPIVLLLYFIAPRRLRNTVLFVASLIFYAWGEPKLVLLMIATIVVDYCAGLMIERFSEKKKASRAILVAALVINLGLLGIFKYANFMIESINALVGGNIGLLNIVLPIGISFYTFQSLSYVIDVYKKVVPVERNILNFATYVTLFPQLIAGPIVQYKTIADELSERQESFALFSEGTMMAYRGSISPDSLAVDVKGLEDWAASSKTQTADRAVLYSILGEMKIKEDFEKGNEYLHLSLKDRMNLVDYSAEKLVPMVETGETSRLYFANNLYDLVARRAIRLWNENLWNSQREVTLDTIRQTYQTLLDIYKEKGMRSAWLLTALDAYPQADKAQLREWIKEYGDLEVCAEVYLRLSQWMMMREDEPAKRLALLREGISRYPKYSRINALKNEEKEILAPRLSMSVDYAYPERPMDVKVNYRNIGGFTFRIYRLNLSAESPSLSKVNPQTVHQYGALLREEHFSLPATPDYRGKIETVKVEAPQSGIYYLMTIPDGHASLKKGIQLLKYHLRHQCFLLR